MKAEASFLLAEVLSLGSVRTRALAVAGHDVTKIKLRNRKTGGYTERDEKVQTMACRELNYKTCGCTEARTKWANTLLYYFVV